MRALLEAARRSLGKELMRRRRIIAGLMLSLVAPLAAEAQKAGKVFKRGDPDRSKDCHCVRS